MTFRRAMVNRQDKVIPALPVVNALLDTASARGIARGKLLRHTGLFEEDLSATKRISIHQLLTLIANVQQQVKGYDAAFQAGAALANSHIGGALMGLDHCRHFADARRFLLVGQWAWFPLIAISTQRHNGFWRAQISDAVGCNKQWPFVVEMYAAMLVALSKRWCGKRLPFHFDFPSSRPRYIQEYEEYLGYRIRFEQPELLLKLPEDAVSWPFQQAHHGYQHLLRQFVLKQCCHGLSLPNSIRRLANNAPALTLVDAAQSLDISPATLKRKLSEHGMTFKALVDEVRRRQAVNFISMQKLNNEQSASKMAFTDITNFRRAVKRWTGLTPSALRELG